MGIFDFISQYGAVFATSTFIVIIFLISKFTTYISECGECAERLQVSGKGVMYHSLMYMVKVLLEF